MGDEQNRAAPAEVLDELQALGLERLVTDGQHLVDDQDIGLGMGADRERQPRIHAARIELHRPVEELADAGEVGNRVQTIDDELPPHAENRAADQHVFAAGELRIEAGAERQHRRDAPARLDRAVGRLRDPADELQQRGLAGAVAADDAEALALGDFEIDVPQHPEFLVIFLHAAEQHLPHAVVVVLVDLKRLPDSGAAHDPIR